MQIHVLLFAQLVDTTGCRSIDLELPDGATVADALATLEREHAPIATYRDHIAVAVNEAYAKMDRHLKDGDTLAMIPPVSGG